MDPISPRKAQAPRPPPDDKESCYPRNTVLWAIIDGFPAWPSRVVSRKEISQGQLSKSRKIAKNKALVMFFNDNNRFSVVDDSKLELYYADTVNEVIKRNRTSKKFLSDIKVACQNAEEFIQTHVPVLNVLPPERRKLSNSSTTPAIPAARQRGKSPRPPSVLKRSNSRTSIERKSGPGRKKRKSSSISPTTQDDKIIDDDRNVKRDSHSTKNIRRPRGGGVSKRARTSNDSLKASTKRQQPFKSLSSMANHPSTGNKRGDAPSSSSGSSSGNHDSGERHHRLRADDLMPPIPRKADTDDDDHHREEISTKRLSHESFGDGGRGRRGKTSSDLNRDRDIERDNHRSTLIRDHDPTVVHAGGRHESLSENEESPAHYSTKTQRGRGKGNRGRGSHTLPSPGRIRASGFAPKKSFDEDDDHDRIQNKPPKNITSGPGDIDDDDGAETDSSSGRNDDVLGARPPYPVGNDNMYTARRDNGDEMDLFDGEDDHGNRQHQDDPNGHQVHRQHEHQTGIEDDGEDTIDDDDDEFDNIPRIAQAPTDPQNEVEDERSEQVMKEVSLIEENNNDRGEDDNKINGNGERIVSPLMDNVEDSSSIPHNDDTTQWDDGDGEVMYDGYDCVPETTLIKPFDELTKDELIKLLVRREKEIGRLHVLLWRQGALLRKTTLITDVNDVFDHCETAFHSASGFVRFIEEHNCTSTPDCRRNFSASTPSKSKGVDNDRDDDSVNYLKIQDCENCKADYVVRENQLCAVAHKLSEVYFSKDVNMKPVFEQISNIIANLRGKSTRAALAFRNVAGLWEEICSSYQADDEELDEGKDLLRGEEPDMQMDSSNSERDEDEDDNDRKGSDYQRKRSRDRQREHDYEQQLSPYGDHLNRRERDLKQRHDQDDERSHQHRDYDGDYNQSLRTPSPHDSDEDRVIEQARSGDDESHRKETHEEREDGDVMEESNDRALQSVMAEEANEHDSKSDKMDVEDEARVSDRGEISDKEDGKSSTDAVKKRRGFDNVTKNERHGNTDKPFVHDDNNISGERMDRRNERNRENGRERERSLRINGNGRRSSGGAGGSDARGRRVSGGGRRGSVSSRSDSRRRVRSRSSSSSHSRGRRRSRSGSRDGRQSGSESDRGADRISGRWRGRRERGRNESPFESRASYRSSDARRREGSNASRDYGVYRRGRKRTANPDNGNNEEHGTVNGREASSPQQYGRSEHMARQTGHRLDKENRYESNDCSTTQNLNHGNPHSKRANNGDRSEDGYKQHRSKANGSINGLVEKKSERGEGRGGGDKLSKERKDGLKQIKEAFSLLHDDKVVKQVRKEIVMSLEVACWRYSRNSRERYQQACVSLHRLIQNHARNRNSGSQTPSDNTISKSLHDMARNEKGRAQFSFRLVEFCMEKTDDDGR